MDRRAFLQTAASISAGVAFAAQAFAAPERLGESVAALATAPMDKVRVGFIGLGMRGLGSLVRLIHVEGVEIVAICDLIAEKAAKGQETLTKANRPEAAVYGVDDPEAWRTMCERDDIDLVYACTPWELHTPNAVHAMKCGKHVAVEVPAAVTLDECWQLVDTSVQTRKHCMMLENCCYDFLELASLNMARQGVLGEIIHAECAYIHDLRELKFDPNGYYERWRLGHSIRRNGNVYSTHGLGPVAQCMNINRGDVFEKLVSMSTGQFGLSLYANEKFGPDSPEAKQAYKLGDMNTTLVRTASGHTIMVQHDTTSPRPYSRIHLLSGTKGIIQKWPEPHMALAPDSHVWMSSEEMEKKLKEFEHPLVAKIGEEAQKVGGHGGMDYMMDWRLIQCLRKGEPLDQDVYDAATWSSIGPLSEESVAGDGASIQVPDFTRGAWRSMAPLGIVS